MRKAICEIVNRRQRGHHTSARSTGLGDRQPHLRLGTAFGLGQPGDAGGEPDRAGLAGSPHRRIKEDGGCWEVYAINPEDRKVEAYFHPVTHELEASEED